MTNQTPCLLQLNHQDLDFAKRMAQNRYDTARQRGWRDKAGRPSVEPHINGVLGELSLCRLLDLPYKFTNGTRKKEPDCYQYDVRARTKDSDSLIIRHDDPPERPTALILLNREKLTARCGGWAFAGDIQELGRNHHTYIPSRNGWPSCWMVPQSELNSDIERLRQAT